MTPTQAVKLAETKARLAMLDLAVLVGRDKVTKELLYFVESTRDTIKNGYLTFRTVKKITGHFICTCEHGRTRGNLCVHKLAAKEREDQDAREAARIADEKKRIDAASFRSAFSDFFCGIEDQY